MHPYVLIPLLSSIAAVALAAAVVVRDPSRRANYLLGLLLVAAGWWSLCEALWNAAPTAEAAVRLARWSSPGSLALSPLAFHVILTFRPGFEERFRVALVLTYLAALVGCIATITTPYMIIDVSPTSWGWAPHAGPISAVVFVALTAGPLWAIASSLRFPRVDPARNRLQITWIQSSIAIPFTVATVTDFVLPAQGIGFPRLGCTGLILWGAVVWWTEYRFRVPILSPQRFAREILAALPNGVMLVRTDGRVRTANEAANQLAGSASGTELGGRLSDLLDSDESLTDDGGERECFLRAGPGERVPVSVSRATLRDEAGKAVGYVLTLRDLREVVSLRSRLLTSGRLAAVGELAAGIAHEINNPVAYVRSNLSMLERHWAGMPERVGKAAPTLEAVFDDGAQMLRDSVEGIERVASIVRDVGGFARLGPAAREMADLNELLDTAIRVATPQLRSRARVVRDYGELPMVTCMPWEMMQVFLNLLMNAAHAVERDGTIRLVTTAREDCVEVRVEDDGPGIGPEDAERLFDPFFTTKPADEGTGLGLAISRQIVDRLGGEISHEPRPGGGAVFRVCLPAEPAEATAV